MATEGTPGGLRGSSCRPSPAMESAHRGVGFGEYLLRFGELAIPFLFTQQSKGVLLVAMERTLVAQEGVAAGHCRLWRMPTEVRGSESTRRGAGFGELSIHF